MILGCSDADPSVPGWAYDGGGGADAHLTPGAQGGAPSCEEGSTRSCKNVVTQANGVTSCWVGEQECLTNQWGPCHDAEP